MFFSDNACCISPYNRQFDMCAIVQTAFEFSPRLLLEFLYGM